MKPLILNTKERVRKFFARIGSEPRKDWKFFLGFIVVFLVLVSIYHVYLFFSAYEKVPNQIVGEAAAIKTIDREGLANALKRVDARDNDYVNFVSNPPIFKDPSF